MKNEIQRIADLVDIVCVKLIDLIVGRNNKGGYLFRLRSSLDNGSN